MATVAVNSNVFILFKSLNNLFIFIITIIQKILDYIFWMVQSNRCFKKSITPSLDTLVSVSFIVSWSSYNGWSVFAASPTTIING